MKKNSITDYSAFILLKALGLVLRSLPLALAFFIGRRLGDLWRLSSPKRRCLVYSNLKGAFGAKLSPRQINRISRDFFRAFGENLIEVFLIPRMDKGYLRRYLRIEGKEHLEEARKSGRAVIFLGVHAGSWEMSNAIADYSDIELNFFMRQQAGSPLLDKLLNEYRSQKGRVISRQGQLRELVRLIKDKHFISMTLDQGGRAGVAVEFFGKGASMSTGAVKLALRHGLMIMPVFYRRIKGPYVNIIFDKPFEVKRGASLAEEVRNNIGQLVRVFEKHITAYPAEYLWTYKIWKYSQERRMLILDDGKTGHLRQAQSMAGIISEFFSERGITTSIDTVSVRFKAKRSSLLLSLATLASGKYSCQGCLWCFRRFLDPDSYRALIGRAPDIVISCGSKLSAVNHILSRQNNAKSVVIMRPSFPEIGRFDLVVMARHDRPPRRKNVVITEGALNLVNEKYLQGQAKAFRQLTHADDSKKTLGLLVGGDTKNFRLQEPSLKMVIKALKETAEESDGQVLVTTSRRTPQQIESQIKEEFGTWPRCSYLVIASQNNIPEAVGGILALSDIVVVSPESISMVSEAANSGKHVLVFESGPLDPKHREFLDNFAARGYIKISAPQDMKPAIKELWSERSKGRLPEDNLRVKEALKEVL